jgi:hypothetical protein
MGLFGGIKDTMRKSEAAVIAQNLLEIQANRGIFFGNAAALANEMIGKAWDEKPHFFNGSKTDRPHKLTVAAISLAHFCKNNPDDPSQEAVLTSLGMALDEASRNGKKYGFRQIDVQLLNGAAAIFTSLVPDDGA